MLARTLNAARSLILDDVRIEVPACTDRTPRDPRERQLVVITDRLDLAVMYQSTIFDVAAAARSAERGALPDAPGHQLERRVAIS